MHLICYIDKKNNELGHDCLQHIRTKINKAVHFSNDTMLFMSEMKADLLLISYSFCQIT
jgi:hypothetical protein